MYKFANSRQRASALQKTVPGAAHIMSSFKKEVAMPVTLHPGGNARGNLTHVDRELSIAEVSRVMSRCGAEELLVTDLAEGALVAVGVVSARDIVTRVVAAGLDPEVLTAGDIAWSDAAGSWSTGCA
jgi:CBS domain-containing protein